MTETHETKNEKESHGCCGGSGKPEKVEVKQEEANSDKHSCGSHMKSNKHSCGDHAKPEHDKENEKPAGGCCS